MGLTSSLNEVEDAILALLLADTNLSALSKGAGKPRLGDPGAGIQAEHVFLVGEATTEQTDELTRPAGGSGLRRELVRIQIVVRVQRNGDDFVALRNRASVLVELVEGIIRANPFLPGSTLPAAGAAWYCELVGMERAEGAGSKVRILDHVLHVQAVNYLA